MKKVLSILLAVLMLALPLASFATEEACSVRLSYAFDAEAMMTFMTDILGDTTGMEEQLPMVTTSLSALSGLLNSMSLEAQWQDGGVKLSMVMGEDAVADVTVTWTDTQVLLATSLVPGYVFTLDVNLKEIMDAFAKVDWAEAATQAGNAVLAWVDGVWADGAAPQVEFGSFIGDAYTGGTQRVTLYLTDADVAGLADSVADALHAQADVCALLDTLGGADTFFEELKAANGRVAENNQYSYAVALTLDDREVFAGLSLTTYNQGNMETTLSIGAPENGLCMVLGIAGMFLQADLTGETKQNGDNYTMDMTLDYALYLGKDTMTFREVAMNEANRLMYATTTQQITKDGEHYTFLSKGTAESNMNDLPLTEAVESKGEIIESPFSMAYDVSVAMGNTPLVTAKMIGGVCEPFAPIDTEYCVALDLTSDDLDAIMEEEPFNTAVTNGATNFTIAVFQHLPEKTVSDFISLMTVFSTPTY